MNRIFIVFIFTSLSVGTLFAQHESLFDDWENLGGFGGPILEFSSINGQLTADVGGGGALIFDEFFLGGYGMGTDYPEIVITREIDGEILDIDYNIDFGHGGLWMGYVQQVERKTHLYTDLKIGWGQAELEHEEFRLPSDRIFVLTPSAGIELNMTSYFKIALTGGYRFVRGVSRLPDLNNQDFSSPTGSITFRFGWFGIGDD
jgi:hypothetical protein